MAELKRNDMTVKQEKAVLVGLILPRSTADPRDPLGELASLAKTAGAKVVDQVIQRRQHIDAATYIGSGKAAEIARLAAQRGAGVIIFDNDLSPGQIGALEKLVNTEINAPRLEGIKILDRSELILDIFATRARTHEARLQVALAQMEYTYPRLTRMWGHLERIASGSSPGLGTRGPGEMQLEMDRRIVRKRISELKEQIRHIQQRRGREVAHRTQEYFTICIVGYTNAGKSTLFNTLTAAGAYADDKLFATLDTRTRAWQLERGVRVLLSDTVGFVRDLPHHLVASFRATLEEAVHADLLLHVLDVGHPHAEQQYQSVHQVLKEVGAADKPELLLLNKIDTLEGQDAAATWQTLNPYAIPISAKTARGIDKLHEVVQQRVRGQQMLATLRVETTDGKLLSYIESRAVVLHRDYDDDHTILRVRVGKNMLADLSRHSGLRIEAAQEAGPTPNDHRDMPHGAHESHAVHETPAADTPRQATDTPCDVTDTPDATATPPATDTPRSATPMPRDATDPSPQAHQRQTDPPPATATRRDQSDSPRANAAAPHRADQAPAADSPRQAERHQAADPSRRET